jgi:hypothetical protein
MMNSCNFNTTRLPMAIIYILPCLQPGRVHVRLYVGDQRQVAPIRDYASSTVRGVRCVNLPEKSR